MATDDLKALDILDAEIDRVMIAAPHSDCVRIPLHVAAKCRAAIASTATLEAQLAARDALLETARKALCEYACHAGEKAPCIRKCHPDECGLAAADAIVTIDTAIASGDYAKGQDK